MDPAVASVASSPGPLAGGLADPFPTPFPPPDTPADLFRSFCRRTLVCEEGAAAEERERDAWDFFRRKLSRRDLREAIFWGKGG